MATTAPTVRSLDQILSELGTVYNPQIQNIQTRQAQLPGQIQAEEQGLAARQESAFGDILSGARRRGTGVAFGGIPLGEQAKYTATEYMPALARLRQSGREQAMSLEDAINSLRLEQRGAAMTQQQYEQQRRDAFDSERRSLAASAAANTPQKSIAEYLAEAMAANGQTQAPQPQAVTFTGGKTKQDAMSAINNLLQMDKNTINKTIQAITKSAGYGNTYDQAKLELLQAAGYNIKPTASKPTVPYRTTGLGNVGTLGNLMGGIR